MRKREFMNDLKFRLEKIEEYVRGTGIDLGKQAYWRGMRDAYQEIIDDVKTRK